MIDTSALKEFYYAAAGKTFAGGGKPDVTPERPGFIEYTVVEGDLVYKDSYAGHFRSWGTEVIRHQGVPVWSVSYGGGMVSGHESLADETFGFLRQAMSAKPAAFSARGPNSFKAGEFEYTYSQQGDFESFSGAESILYKGNQVFFHQVIGGRII